MAQRFDAANRVRRASVQVQGAAIGAGDAAIARIVTRLSSEYVLRAFQLLLDPFGDIRTGLLVLAINTANVAALVRTREGRGRAGPDGTFPDDVRRPISIARVAESAGLPFESTRRIVQRLINAGDCRRVEGGVIVLRAVVERPSIFHAVSVNVGYVRKFMRDLQSAGLDAAVPLAESQASKSAGAYAADARTVSVLSAEYILRALQLLADAYGDIRAGIVAQTIVTANTAHLDAPRGEGYRYAGIAQTPPDEVRRPISIARLAESLGLPYETMRARVRRLIDAGVCVQLDAGLIVPGAVLERPTAARSMLANVGYARKLMRDLHAVGFDGDPHDARQGPAADSRRDEPVPPTP
jgi:DNA-binding Lrp family transcriptional regulator